MIAAAATAKPAKAALPEPHLAQFKAKPRKIYRLSVRGRRSSRAARLHCANLRFATIDAANKHHAHKGDHAQVRVLTVSDEYYHRLFPSPMIPVADLRKVYHPR